MLKIQRLILLLVPTLVFANNSLNLQIPNAGNNYSYDEVRSSDNMSCKNAIGGATNLEFGITGIVNNAVPIWESGDPANPTTKDVGLYARITIPLDKPKERINCNTLYKLELQKKRLEVMKLQQELKKLQDLQFINNGERN